jgi:YidC/Oxa1 family membrane protein insertase
MNIFSAIGDFFGLIINRPLGFILYYCYQVGHNYGIALILFTLITRLLLFPLAIKQQRSTAEMARMQPKMQQIQKKFAKDKTRQTEELQKLYQEEGYNPLGGCLPLLIQLPILWGLFGVIYRPLTYILGYSQDTVNKIISVLKPQIMALGGITDASKFGTLSNKIEILAAKAMSGHMGQLTFLPKNSIHLDFNFLGVDLSSQPTFALNVLILIPILCYITNLISSWLTMKITAAAQPNQQAAAMNNKMMIVLMPIMSTWFSFQVPAGVGFYWIITNLFMILQVFILNKFFSIDRLMAEAEETAGRRREKREKLLSRLAASQIETGADAAQPEEGESAENGGEESSAPPKAQTARPQPTRVSSSGKKKTNRQMKEENRRRLAASRKQADKRKESGK